jgi:hypothetical protein
MRRREFITLVGGAVAAWPLMAHAQQAERVRRIGVLYSLAADDPESVTRRAAFEQALKELGWTNGSNLRIDYRWAGNDPELIRKFVAELVAAAPDVIVTSGSVVVGPMVRATLDIPIVFLQAIDPVGSGLIESMAQPGGNVHWLYAIRIQSRRKMAGVAQRDRAKSVTGGGPKGCHAGPRDWPIRCHPGYGTAASCGVESNQCRGSGRDGARDRSICALPKCRAGCDGRRNCGSPQCNHRCCGQAPIAGRLPISLLRQR